MMGIRDWLSPAPQEPDRVVTETTWDKGEVIAHSRNILPPKPGPFDEEAHDG